MNLQEVFNVVYKHLLTQNARSTGEIPREGNHAFKKPEPSCLYRSPEGLKCAFGVLIEDNEYRPSMEGNNAYSVICNYQSLSNKFRNFTSPIGTLQYIHDYVPVENWKNELEKFAADNHLEVPQL